MKTDLSFLPEKKQQELREITKQLLLKCNDIELVILYGSYARNDYKEAKDLAPGRWSGHISDYDILLVTGKQETAQDRKLHSQLETYCSELNLSATPRIIMFDLQELNISLAEGQYFYSDVKKEGIVLFNEKGHTLAHKRELTNTEKARIAQDHFDVWYETASSAYKISQLSYENNELKWSLFHLHQTTEACYKCLLLVYTNYSPDEHYLHILGNQASDEVPAIAGLFPTETESEFQRFTLLDKAYIGARYIRDFFVENEDIEYLAPLVKRLLETTKAECKKRINALKENRETQQ